MPWSVRQSRVNIDAQQRHAVSSTPPTRDGTSKTGSVIKDFWKPKSSDVGAVTFEQRILEAVHLAM